MKPTKAARKRTAKRQDKKTSKKQGQPAKQINPEELAARIIDWVSRIGNLIDWFN